MASADIKKKAKEILIMNDMYLVDREYQILSLSKNPESFQILLELLASGDVLHVQEAARVLALKGDFRYIEDILNIRKHLPSRGGLRDYRKSIDDTILILEERKKGHECNCGIYSKTSFHPRYEEKIGFIKIINEVVNENNTVYSCICNKCDRKWQVEEDLTYHYPIYSWH